jgi:peptidoglycan/LPS O-acetylase OafA/YrhL
MVFAAGFELVVVSVALSLPLWLVVEELVNRSRVRIERRPATEVRRQPVRGMAQHPVH